MIWSGELYVRLLRFLGRNGAIAIFSVVACSFIVFTVSSLTPTSTARQVLGQYALDSQVAALERELGLDRPLLVRYGQWLSVLVGLRADPLMAASAPMTAEVSGNKYFLNFGQSVMYNTPVGDVLLDRLKNTALLAAFTIILSTPLSFLFGVAAGAFAGTLLDRTLTAAAITVTSIPEFASAVFLIAIFVVVLEWLPGSSPLDAGSGWPVASQFVLPVAVLSLYLFGYLARIIRSSMIEVMQNPYIRAAVIKGVPTWRVIIIHALRNAMIVPFTLLLLQVNWLIGGVVVTETVFGYPGIGKTLVDAALFGDVNLVSSIALLAIVMTVATQIVGDLVYDLLNPKIRF